MISLIEKRPKYAIKKAKWFIISVYDLFTFHTNYRALITNTLGSFPKGISNSNWILQTHKPLTDHNFSL